MDGIHPPPTSAQEWAKLGWFQQVFRWIQRRTTTLAVTADTTVPAHVGAVFANATGGAITVTLPSASEWSGREIEVTKSDASANAVAVSGAVLTVSLSARYYTVTVKSDGTNWYIKTRFPAVAG
jgi:hypothetical protein